MNNIYRKAFTGGKSMAKICVVGSVNMDVVTYVDHIPKPGQTVFGERLVEMAGGKGANQAVAVAKQEKEVALIGSVGSDRHGEILLEGLENFNVDTTNIEKLSGIDSGKTSIVVENSGENFIIYLEGANGQLDKDYVREALQKQTNCGVLLVQLESPYEVVLEAMKTAKEQGITVILDPAPSRNVTDELLAYADIVLPNEQEAKDITGIDIEDEATAQAAAAIFRDKGIKKGVLKVGARGSYVFNEEKITFVEPIRVEAVDSVGAGDCFAGAFASAYVDELPIVEAARHANIVAALKVTKAGAQDGIPTLDEVKMFCKERHFELYIEDESAPQ